MTVARRRISRLLFTCGLAALVSLNGCSRVPHPTASSAGSSPAVGTQLVADGSSLFGAMSVHSFGSVVDWSTFTIAGDPQPFVIAADPPNAPGNLAFTVAGDTVVLTWSPPAGGSTVNTYLVEAGTVAGQDDITRFDTGSPAPTLTVSGVPAGTYFVRVRAANIDGAGPPANEVTIVVGSGPCPPPLVPTGLAGSASGNVVTLRWNDVAGALAFILEAGTAPDASNIASFDTGNTATSLTANAPAGTYFIRVRARTACGTSGASNEVVVTVGSAPPGGGLSGLWEATVTIRSSTGPTGTEEYLIDVTHSDSRLTGVFRNSGTPPVTFDLTHLAGSNPPSYSGTLVNTDEDAAGCRTKQGLVTAHTATRLTGSFAAQGCSEVSDLDLIKVH